MDPAVVHVVTVSAIGGLLGVDPGQPVHRSTVQVHLVDDICTRCTIQGPEKRSFPVMVSTCPREPREVFQ
jgi:hypothetical protein